MVKRDIGDGNLANLPKVYESIWATYKEDVEKYASNSTERRVIKHVMDTAPLYLDQRIKFHNFGNSNSNRSFKVIYTYQQNLKNVLTTNISKAYLNLKLNEEKIISSLKEIESSKESVRLSRLRYDVGIVFQDPFSSLNPRHTVKQIIGEGLDINKSDMKSQKTTAD